MSSLLEQAIIDARVLMETARKNAEASLINKYEPEIVKHIESLLEQDEPSLGGNESEDVPNLDMDAAALGGPSLGGAQATPETQRVVDKAPAAYLGEDNTQVIEFDLDSIVEKVDQMQKQLNIQIPDMAEPAHEVVPHSNLPKIPPESLAENENLEEECLEEGGCTETMEEDVQEEQYQIDEEMFMDFKNVSAGGLHANEIELKRQHDIAKALAAQNAELLEQIKTREEQFSALEEKLESLYTNLKETKTRLKNSSEINVKLKEGFDFLTKKISDVNLLNARLLYTNKVLGNGSLNERQKQQIAESISKSKTVDEARTIYNTLQKSAGATTERKSAPKSLTEAIARAPSPFLPRNNNTSTVDPNIERWQRIAGIKK